MNNLLLSSTSSTKTFAVAPEVTPVIISPTINLAPESSNTILSLFQKLVILIEEDMIFVIRETSNCSIPPSLLMLTIDDISYTTDLGPGFPFRETEFYLWFYI